ncbi:hypothetical protein P3342_012507 [Pyrenophora teres f. teres]|nr:hypothetical protein P3342_012507 [Pyrenophora teres f. teres]
MTSPTSQTAGWSPATPSGASASEQAFLAPLFDREDYLLAKDMLDGETDEDDDPDEGRIDPRLLQHKPTFDVPGLPHLRPTFILGAKGRRRKGSMPSDQYTPPTSLVVSPSSTPSEYITT